HLLGMLLALGFAAARTAAQEPGAKKDAAKAAPVDLYGDPLPPGAVARLGTVRFRRSGYFVGGRSGLGFLADNKTLVTGDSDAVQFWESGSGKLLREVRPPYGVGGFAISADGRRYAVGTSDQSLDIEGPGRIRVFDADTGKLLQTVSRASFRDAHECGLALSADGGLLFSNAHHAPLRVEDVASGKELRKFKMLDGSRRGMQVSPDGEHLAIALSSKLYLCKWRAHEPKVVGTARGRPSEDFSGVSFSPDSKKLAMASDRLAVLDVDTGKVLYERND